MLDQAETTVTPVVANDGPAADACAAAVLATRLQIIDVAVRRARDEAWCEQFEAIMDSLFPDGMPGGGTEFVDSDGFSCRNRDRDGYDQQGYDRDGVNRDGYNARGYDRDGYNRDGYNRQGWNRQGLNRDGRDRNSPEVRAQYGFDYYGYDRDGYNAAGYDVWGHTREVNERAGTDPYRFNADGVDLDGGRNRTY
jgi:hypothetical protein